jgi:hypothetical protein
MLQNMYICIIIFLFLFFSYLIAVKMYFNSHQYGADEENNMNIAKLQHK